MIFVVGFAALVSSCDVGQVEHQEGCVDVCNNMFFDNNTQTCEAFKECQAGEYLELKNNTCVSQCGNGYFENGVCICYAGWKKDKDGSCVYDNSYDGKSDYTLGLDWFYWGCIFIVVVNGVYLVFNYLRYRKKVQKNSGEQVI